MNPRRIDIHHHFLPSRYREWLSSKGIVEGSGRKGGFPEWSPELALEVMDHQGIEIAVVSISTPGVCLSTDPSTYPDACATARMVNEEGAKLLAKTPNRFRFFATLPMPDVEGSIQEACHALDHLGASGVILMANTHGRYVGDSCDEPLFKELNRRKALVFIHPSELEGPAAPDVPPYATDFLLDTSRAAYRLVANGFIQRFPDLKIILAHAGGFVPYAAYRMAGSVSFQTGRSLPEILADFGSFYFDTALSSSPSSLPSLTAFAKPDRILFGSDWPFVPASGVSFFTGMLDQFKGLDDFAHVAINVGNAEKLLPRVTKLFK
jgi:predicted TIM-barrel fold metal-dependent hydrolase